MALPRHLERLVESHVERDVARSAQHVAIANFTRTGRTEAAIHRFGIAEDVRRTFLRRRGAHRIHPLTVRLNVPVCGPDAAIERRLNRQSAVPTEDAGGLPTAN